MDLKKNLKDDLDKNSSVNFQETVESTHVIKMKEIVKSQEEWTNILNFQK